ncbi:MAG: mechanosensitive ion channel, partial [Gammaproteobacteria bacterium]|nr:mechanosensitive ion channel [Gammaproteobacteria bacterium]
TGRSYNVLVGNITFWSVLLFFMAASANMLDWQIFSDFLGTLLTYLPHLFAGLLIILAGFVVGGVVHSLIETTASTAGIARPQIPARIAQVAVVMTSLVIGIEQLGINITFLTTTLIVVAGVLLSGAALAFGLGARHYVANLIGAQISQKHYQVGQFIKFDDIEGYLLEITQTALVLDTERGRAVVPACRLQQDVSEIVTSRGDTNSSLLGNLFRKKDDSDGTT